MPESNEANQYESAFGVNQRQEQIAEYVLRHSSVRIQELAERFNVSLMTIHRDLDELEAQGIIRKVRGGATAQPSNSFESDIRYRLITAIREKEAIAERALTYIEPGQAIIMDDATTTLALARMLHRVTPLTVITNSLAIVKEVSPVRGIHLISLGGTYFHRYDAFVGMICEQTLSTLRANLLFMSASALSDGYTFHQEQEIVQIKSAMLKSAPRRILLIDHHKIGRIALHRLADLHEFETIITDNAIQPEVLKKLREAHASIETAP
ncbi:DeoR/GlpR transcriptional regulator [Ktedonosporobacter rubrisoli]|uniref:DeoR/GlpR transcriptional regulator n=1 Tax=Ktedonosporobacter rubrisoli TaxID=2509675 RepID=A0A4P6JSX2_KTERU|nr:DeoR/GlpR family DNA-binding transcription regulator [Ktedonosporobacter rubrisoli]QBD78658.1 DeoR/GlpR transcriptional regulator [Ktedonosporobacter rubrisoli]